MQKDWLRNKVDVYFEDIELERDVRRSFANAIENSTDDQVVAFAQAVNELSELPSTRAVLVESYEYSY